MKYTDTQIGFQEFPDEISLLINISNCPFHCPGCHSPELWEDIGIELTKEELSKLIQSNKGITCIGFMGGNLKEVSLLAEYVKNIDSSLKVGWYTGGIITEKKFPELEFFNYIKTGPYIRELGGLNYPSTNQRFYKIEHLENEIKWSNLTYKFWKHGNNE